MPAVNFGAILPSLTRIALQLPPFILQVVDALEGQPWGSLDNVDQAEALARNVSEDLGNVLALRVKGVDVIDRKAQSHIAGAVGRIVYRTVKALHPPA